MSTNIKVYLSVCNSATSLQVGEKSYIAGSRQEFHDTILEVLDNDMLSLSIPNHCSFKIGSASKINAISIRYLGEKNGRVKGIITALYDDPLLLHYGCCVCCEAGWCACGDSGCECGPLK
ncbi:hypothetical protein HDF18_06335 [Mucilaginibacter sp. X5P1]|uniref:hypothetical protein n=1 Tax=Mucilaginibacter sp. X5P1 TaxID=2723088 RepID=UPI0016209155|nr:hypothetical protein [Mucilaginibacter sp. X5P1]MBB6137254.1 hypothetical protein [Mucilaginibacter sp. X5P1]